MLKPRFCLVLLALWLMSACAQRGGEGGHWVPADAEASLVVPDLNALRESLEVFLAGVEGASGALALLDARTGLDLGSREGLVAGGIAPDRSAALFWHQGSLGVALGVSDKARFDARVRRQLSRMGAILAENTAEASISGVASGRHSASPWSLAWGLSDDGVGLVIWRPQDEDAAERWQRLAGTERDGGARLKSATSALGQAPGVHLRVTGSPIPPASWGLGPAKMMLLPIISGLDTWQGTWVVEPTKSTLTLDAPWNADGALASGWFKPKGEVRALGRSIPKAQTATLRARVNPAKVLAIPAFLRNRFLPKRVPGPLSLVLPPIEELLTLLNGDVALTLLGLDAQATVEDALGPVGLPQLLQHLHVGVVLGVTDAAAARQAVAAARHHLKEAGWFPVALEAGGWKGVALRREESNALWSIITKENQVAILSGGGEVARFVQVAEGSALSLSEAAEGEVAKAAAESGEVALGLSASFRRITRELAAKGAPPFFLKMVNDIRAISGTISARDDGASLILEVRL